MAEENKPVEERSIMVRLVPMTDAEFQVYLARAVDNYAQEHVNESVLTTATRSKRHNDKTCVCGYAVSHGCI